MRDWKEYLAIEKDLNSFNHIEFLNKYEHIIPGSNRDAKRKKIKYYLENPNPKQRTTKEKKQKEFIQETSVFDASNYDLNIEPNKKIRFGLIGDTHFGSKYSQLTHLHYYYDICAKKGITDIYHCGDITDGENMRPGHAYENYIHGADEHIKELVNNYPYREGIVTHFITGNHDASFIKSCGLDIGNHIANKRSDLQYLGKDVVNINITDNITMQLRHPWSSSAYALSYRPQKIVESMEAACLDKPDILCIGHFHKMEYLFYHNIHVFQTGCFQSATPFTTGKGISVAMGGWIIEIETNSEGKIKTIIPQAIPFNKAILKDYENYSR